VEGRTGLERDYKKGVELFEQAIDEGSDSALVSLGNMYDHGAGGLEKNPRKAVALYLRAAKLGNADGMKDMGLAYALGMDGPRNDQIAADWFAKAVAAGSEDSYVLLGLELRDLKGAGSSN
jgi:hypothetical protein